MRKITLIFFTIILFSCGNKPKEEKQVNKIKNQTEAIEKQSVKILVTFNQAIKEHKKAVSDVYEMARQLNWSDRTLSKMRPNWKQKGWDTLYVHFKIKKLTSDFKEKFGEDEFNKLQLKIDENWNKKMN